MTNTVMVVCDNNKFVKKVKKVLALSNTVEAVPVSKDIHGPIIPYMLMFNFKVNSINGFNLPDKLDKFLKTMRMPVVKMTCYYVKEKDSSLMHIRVRGTGICFKPPLEIGAMLSGIEKGTKNSYRKLMFILKN